MLDIYDRVRFESMIMFILPVKPFIFKFIDNFTTNKFSAAMKTDVNIIGKLFGIKLMIIFRKFESDLQYESDW